MEALLQVEAVSNSRNEKALRRLFDNISSHIRSLDSLEVKEETCGNLLCPILINKIPADLQLTVSKVPEAEWKLTTLLATIEEEIIAREIIAREIIAREIIARERLNQPLANESAPSFPVTVPANRKDSGLNSWLLT